MAKVDTTKSVTPTNGKQTETVPESSAEGEVITLDQSIATTKLNAGTMENATTMKRNAERRNEIPLRPVNNSRIMLRTPTTIIVAECSR